MAIFILMIFVLCFLTGLVFVTLKAMGIILWSWWLVTMPFWGPYILLIVVLSIAFAVAVFQNERDL